MGQGRGFKWLAQSVVAMDQGWFEATGSIENHLNQYNRLTRTQRYTLGAIECNGASQKGSFNPKVQQ
jgi:hypothetical protein